GIFFVGFVFKGEYFTSKILLGFMRFDHVIAVHEGKAAITIDTENAVLEVDRLGNLSPNDIELDITKVLLQRNKIRRMSTCLDAGDIKLKCIECPLVLHDIYKPRKDRVVVTFWGDFNPVDEVVLIIVKNAFQLIAVIGKSVVGNGGDDLVAEGNGVFVEIII